MNIDLKVIGDHIWLDGVAVAQLRVPEGTLRDKFLTLVDPHLLHERIEEEKELAYDTGYDDGHDAGHAAGYSEGLAEGEDA